MHSNSQGITKRIRASNAVISVPKGENVLFYNFLTRTAAICSTDALYWLSCFPDWSDIGSVQAAHPHIEAQSLKGEILKLAELGLLNFEHSENAKQEEKYSKEWEWGLVAGLFHFSILNNTFATSSEGLQKQLQRAEEDPSPSLYWRNDPSAISLENGRSSSISHILQLMACRRTNRTAASQKIGLNQLGDCLFAGMGITAHVQTPTGLLPLGMTPSGGATGPEPRGMQYIERCESRIDRLRALDMEHCGNRALCDAAADLGRTPAQLEAALGLPLDAEQKCRHLHGLA